MGQQVQALDVENHHIEVKLNNVVDYVYGFLDNPAFILCFLCSF
jgi:hypothetical protein